MTDSQKAQVRQLCRAVDAGNLPGVQQLLVNRCPVIAPQVRNPLALAMGKADTPERCAIVEALLKAGAHATDDEICEELKSALKAGNRHLVERAIEQGHIAQPQLGELLTSAATGGRDEHVLWLLELGADPLAKPKNLFGSMFTALELAAISCSPKVASAMAQRLTQQEKDEHLLALVKEGRVHAIPFLLDAGANADQKVKGRSLLELAPTKAMDVKRLLRAHKTASKIASAMPAANTSPAKPPPSESFVL